MEPELSFRTDLYRGTAGYYDRYRRPYPGSLLDDLCRRAAVTGSGRLLDLACGTGQIAFALAGRFAEVVAFDQEPGSVAFGQAKAEAAGVTNIAWATGAAETAQLEGPFDLVAVGNAFHRLDRPAVVARMFSWLAPGGAAVLLWGGIPGRGDLPWQRAMSGLFEEWITRLGVSDRVPPGWEQAMDRHPHGQVLAEVGFDSAGRFDFVAEQTWTVESLTGFVYSTSFLNREALGDRAAEFEGALADLLLSHEPSGMFHESANYAYELALKPRSD
jgi:SAM-dependent methyltransferase